MSQLFDEAAQFYDEETGQLIVGGYIYVGLNGLDQQLNPKAIFSDRELTIPLANPQRTGSDGRPENKIWMSGKYSFLVQNSAGVQKYNELENGFDEQVGNTLLVNALGVNDVVVNGSPTVTALIDSQTYIFTAPADNTGPMTLKIDNTAVMPIKIHHDQALVANDIKASQKVIVVSNLTDSVYEMQTSLPDLRLVLLDTPEVLVNADATEDAWTTVNSATLANASALSALLRVEVTLSKAANLTGISGAVYIRKTGSALPISILTQASKARTSSLANAGTHFADNISQFTVNLDASKDFDWYTDASSAVNVTASIILVGYYV